jgi:hypothetical protein
MWYVLKKMHENLTWNSIDDYTLCFLGSHQLYFVCFLQRLTCCIEWREIQIANKNATLIRNTTPINVQKDYKPNIEKEDAKNVEEKSEGEEEFVQEVN